MYAKLLKYSQEPPSLSLTNYAKNTLDYSLQINYVTISFWYLFVKVTMDKYV